MNDDDLLRYSRHILLDDIGIEGQRRLLAAHVLVIGAGGLGSPVCLFLATAGIGHLTIIDSDIVELTNLQRQIAHDMTRLGMAKAMSAKQSIAAINSDVEVTALQERADRGRLRALADLADVIVDCSDNFATRHAVNAACVAAGKPLVFGSAVAFDGQVATFDTRIASSACYACAFPEDSGAPDVDCATMGVLAPLVGIIGSVQATEALKLLAGVGKPLVGRLLMLDAKAMEWTELQAPRDPHCAVCRLRPNPPRPSRA